MIYLTYFIVGLISLLCHPPHLSASQQVEALIQKLKNEDTPTRREAIVELGKTKDSRAAEALIAFLMNADWDDTEHAVTALKNIGPSAINPLIAAMKEKNVNIRRGAVVVLGEIRDNRAVDPLIAAMNDEDEFVRVKAINALQGVKDPRVEMARSKALGDMKAKSKSAMHKDASSASKIVRPKKTGEDLLIGMLVIFGPVTVVAWVVALLLRRASVPKVARRIVVCIPAFATLFLSAWILEKIDQMKIAKEQQKFAEESRPLAPLVSDFAHLRPLDYFGKTPINDTATIDSAFVVGKVIIVDWDNAELHESWQRLRPELKGMNPDEVGTVVLVTNFTKRTIGEESYTIRGGESRIHLALTVYESARDIIVFDRFTRRAVGRKTLRETDAPMKFRLGQIDYSDRDRMLEWVEEWKEHGQNLDCPNVAQFVEVLPRKAMSK